MAAWFAGEFERCLHLCDAVRSRDAQTRLHVTLLRARALLRLYRLDEALHTLSEVPAVSRRADESVTARMLRGEVFVRRGDAAAGLKLLLAAQREALQAHRTIRSEIALNIGLANYCLHDFSAADQALAVVTKDADLVHARSVQYRAWVASARGDSQRAVALFVRALQLLDECAHHDRYFEANCVRALAHLAVERLDRRAWDFVSGRRQRIDWSLSALAQPRFFIAYCAAAYQLDIEGAALEAVREGRHTEEIAPSDAFRVQARCKRGSIARRLGEHVSHQDHMEVAAEIFGTLNCAQLAGDEKIVPLILAEAIATVNPQQARSLLALHRTLAPMPARNHLEQSSMGRAYQHFVEAVVHESCNERESAVRRYRKAFEAFKAVGYTRRAAMAALALWRLTEDRASYAYAASVTSHLSAQSWMRREVEAAKVQTLRLTQVQREVLGLICQGKSNPDIARLRKRSLHTIRNLVARLFEIFGVTSREELAVEGVRRGLYTPK